MLLRWVCVKNYNANSSQKKSFTLSVVWKLNYKYMICHQSSWKNHICNFNYVHIAYLSVISGDCC